MKGLYTTTTRALAKAHGIIPSMNTTGKIKSTLQHFSSLHFGRQSLRRSDRTYRGVVTLLLPGECVTSASRRSMQFLVV